MGRMQALVRNPAMLALFAALALTGCASKKTLPNNAADLGLAGNATPGSQQDFTVNVGDRIFFDTDSSVIRADAASTLDRQAQWLNQYPTYQITMEGHADERGTREYNLALGARRAAAATAVSVVAWRCGQPHQHDFLRQGAPGRGM
jgi:peptidoglycan-associated lipoprotein